MNDKRQDDDELMSDFKDLFEEESESDSVAEKTVELDDLDDLDRFLDDFSEDLDRINGQDESELPEARDEPAKEAETAEQEEAGLDAAETLDASPAEDDLSEPAPATDVMEDVAEDTDIEPISTSPEQAAQDASEDEELLANYPADDELDLAMGDEDQITLSELTADEQLDDSQRADAAFEPDAKHNDMEPAAGQREETLAAGIAAASAAGAAALSTAKGSASASDGSVPTAATAAGGSGAGRTGRLVGVALALSVVGVVAASVAMVLQLVQPPAAERAAHSLPLPDNQLAVERLRTDVANMSARINELAVMIEGPISHLSHSSEEGMAALEQRLGSLERQVEGLASAAAPRPSASPATATGSRTTTTAERSSTTSTTPSTQGWAINLVSLSNERDARTEMERLRKLGIDVAVQSAQSGGRTWYRLQVRGFESREAAAAGVTRIQQQSGLSGAWVTRE